MRRALLFLATLLALSGPAVLSATADDGARRRHPRPDGRGHRYERRTSPPRQHYRPHRQHRPYRQYDRRPFYGHRPYYRYGPYYGYRYRAPLCTYWVSGYWVPDPWGRPYWIQGTYVRVPCY